MFDENDKGFIEYADLEEALGKMPGAGAVKRKELCDMLSLSDPANTGKIKIKGNTALNVNPWCKTYSGADLGGGQHCSGHGQIFVY